MTRHPVPGTEHWFDLRDLSDLNTDHQDEYSALAINIRQEKQKAAAAAVAAANPAVIADPEQDIPVRLTPADTKPLRELLLSWVLADSSFGVPLPWPLPIIPGNVLRKALDPFYDALNGEVPADPTADGSTTSASTSGDTAAAPQQGQPPGS